MTELVQVPAGKRKSKARKKKSRKPVVSPSSMHGNGGDGDHGSSALDTQNTQVEATPPWSNEFSDIHAYLGQKRAALSPFFEQTRNKIGQDPVASSKPGPIPTFAAVAESVKSKHSKMGLVELDYKIREDMTRLMSNVKADAGVPVEFGYKHMPLRLQEFAARRQAQQPPIPPGSQWFVWHLTRPELWIQYPNGETERLDENVPTFWTTPLCEL